MLDELDRLARAEAEHARAARALALTLPVIPVRAAGDTGVVEAAVRSGGWVVTADRALARRLGEAGVPVLRPRDRARLEARLPRKVGSSTERARPPSRARRARPGNR